MNNKILIIFDLDGTLYKTGDVSLEAIQNALSDLNLPLLSERQIMSLIGDRMEDICYSLTGESDSHKTEELTEKIRHYEWKFIPERAQLYRGMDRVLNVLTSNGFTMAICSNGDADYIEFVTEEIGIKEFFKYIKGKHDNKSKSEIIRDLLKEVNPSFAIMVGDRLHDVKAAHNNNLLCIGVTYGYGENELNGADYIAEKPEDILKIIEEVVKNNWKTGLNIIDEI